VPDAEVGAFDDERVNLGRRPGQTAGRGPYRCSGLTLRTLTSGDERPVAIAHAFGAGRGHCVRTSVR
jgi:hypothetical protein